MKLWFALFFILPLLGAGYALWHVWHLLPAVLWLRRTVTAVLLVCFLMLFATFLLPIDKMPFRLSAVIYQTGASAVFVLLYLVMLLLLLDALRLAHVLPKSLLFESATGSIMLTVAMVALFVYGNLKYHHKERRELSVTTEKALNRPVRVLMLSDLHLGYIVRKGEFESWINLINAENADFIVIAGDIIDNGVRAVRDQGMAEMFHKIKAPVYACLGNHEYLSGASGSVGWYKQAGITLLRDSVAHVGDIDIIGRDDRSNLSRKSIDELMQSTRPGHFTLLLDHQPYNLEQSERAGVDFQLSGHTHYGQVWPVSWVEDRIYEDAYGLIRKGNTTVYVTSGIGIWGGKFRIGTTSEYAVTTIRPKD